METKAEFINHLIDRIHTSTYTGVEQVLTFVDWLDQQLSTLVKIKSFYFDDLRLLCYQLMYLVPFFVVRLMSQPS